MLDHVPATSPDGDPLWDPQRTLERMGDDEQLLYNMIDYFQEDAPKLLAKLGTSLQQNDMSEATRFAHSLKGLCANYDAAKAVDTANRIEECCRKSDSAAAGSHLAHLEGRVVALGAALKLWQNGRQF
ncbi:MAG: Hpt domain-containing protein [Fuerstiella sp.]